MNRLRKSLTETTSISVPLPDIERYLRELVETTRKPKVAGIRNLIIDKAFYICDYLVKINIEGTHTLQSLRLSSY